MHVVASTGTASSFEYTMRCMVPKFYRTMLAWPGQCLAYSRFAPVAACGDFGGGTMSDTLCTVVLNVPHAKLSTMCHITRLQLRSFGILPWGLHCILRCFTSSSGNFPWRSPMHKQLVRWCIAIWVAESGSTSRRTGKRPNYVNTGGATKSGETCPSFEFRTAYTPPEHARIRSRMKLPTFGGAPDDRATAAPQSLLNQG